MDPPCSIRVPRARTYLKTLRPLQDYHLLWSAFPDCSFGLIRFRSPLLTESRLLSFPPGTEMFQFPGFALTPYAFRCQYPEGWVAPFRNPKITACLPAPFGLSQVTTSFIASQRQGIHRAPLVALITPTGCRIAKALKQEPRSTVSHTQSA